MKIILTESQLNLLIHHSVGLGSNSYKKIITEGAGWKALWQAVKTSVKEAPEVTFGLLTKSYIGKVNKVLNNIPPGQIVLGTQQAQKIMNIAKGLATNPVVKDNILQLLKLTKIPLDSPNIENITNMLINMQSLILRGVARGDNATIIAKDINAIAKSTSLNAADITSFADLVFKSTKINKILGGSKFEVAQQFIDKVNKLKPNYIANHGIDNYNALKQQFIDDIINKDEFLTMLKGNKPISATVKALKPKGSVYGDIGKGNKVINEILFVQDSKQYITLVKTKDGVLRPFYMRTGSGTRAGDKAEGWASAGQWVPYFGHADLVSKGDGHIKDGWFIKPNTGRQGLSGDDVISKDLGSVMGVNQQISGKNYGEFGVPKNNITNISTSGDANAWLRSKGYDPSTNSLTTEHLYNNGILRYWNFDGMP